MNNRHSGFTVVELAVASSIASILAAIALPVVQQSREDVRLMECANKMSTLAAGSAMYEDANERMPPWSTGPGPVPTTADFSEVQNDHQHTGAIAYILPFVDEQALFDLMPSIATQANTTLLDSQFGNLGAFFDDPGMQSAFKAKPELLICPANTEYSNAFVEQLGFAVIQTNAGAGFVYAPFTINSTTYGRTSYLPVIGGFLRSRKSEDRALDISLNDAAGAMRNRLTSILASELGDGASNTLLWGESLGNIEEDGQFTRANFSLMSMGIVTGDRWVVGDAIIFGSAEGSTSFLIGSNHPNGNNVAMADGSIRFINSNTSRGVMTALGCGNDGWMVPRKK